jgi:hypothetical protein
MKLFYQLQELEQNEALHYCLHIVLDDLIEEGVDIEPVSDEDFLLKEKLDAAVKHINTLTTHEEKEDYLMSDAFLSKAIYDIALEMAKGAFYHEEDELTLMIDDLHHDHHNDEDLAEDINLINVKSKKTSQLN